MTAARLRRRAIPGGDAPHGRRRWPPLVVVAGVVMAGLVGALVAPVPAGAGVAPGERRYHVMAEAGPGKVVLFGGVGVTGDLKDDTWVWNGTAWKRMLPPQSPPARWQHGMAFDGATGTVVLFGGRGEDLLNLGDTWVWDPRAKTWTDVTPALTEANPGMSSFAMMAYDKVSRKVLVVLLSTTWTWDGPTRTWTREALQGVLERLGIAYDAARGQVVVYARSGTWIWDRSARTWTKPDVASPSPRIHPAMAYDAKRKRIVMFGGELVDTSTNTDETWTWDGSTWTLQAPLRRPSARSRAAMAYNAQSERVVLFGGLEAIDRKNDTWTYAANWRQVA